MAHSTLTDVRGGLPDAADTELFDFIIPSVPGVASQGSSGRDLAVLCQQAVWPGRGNEIMEAPIHGQQLNFAGRVTMPRTMSVTWVERSDLIVTNTFRRWFGFQRGMISGVSRGYKKDYAVDGAVVYKYDTTGLVVDTCVFYGLQPEDMPDVQLDGSSTNLWTCSISLRYDFYVPREVQETYA